MIWVLALVIQSAPTDAILLPGRACGIPWALQHSIVSARHTCGLEVQAHPVAGELVVHRRGFNRRIAKLLAKDGETYLIPVMDKVRLLTINDRGVLLGGYEMHPAEGLQGVKRGLSADVVVRDQPCPRERPIEPGGLQGHGAGEGAATGK